MKKPAGKDNEKGAAAAAKALDPHWLERRDHRNWSHYGRSPSRREREREQLIRDWFGPERGTMEIMAHQSGAQSIGDAMKDVMGSLGLGRYAELSTLQEKWGELVGADIARQAKPIALRNARLEVEVSNPSWMYVLQTTHAKQIEERVREVTEGRVSRVAFVPEGRNYQSRFGRRQWQR